ncbi:MAG: cohesin domain-containing protein [Ardenticatenaceae bacterium]
MKSLRFTSVLLLLVVALLIPFLSQGKISAHTTTPIGFDQPEFDGAANIAADNVALVAQDEQITTSKAQEEETTASLAQPQRPQAASTGGYDPYPYPEPPSALPSINVHVAASEDTINVSWSLDGPLAGDLAKYRLYRSANGGHYVVIADNLMSTQYTDDDASLTSGVDYCYKVQAMTSYGYVIGTSDEQCTEVGSLTIWVPDQVVPPGGNNIPVTINLANGNGLCIRALDIELTYDQTIVRPIDNLKERVKATVFTQGYAFQSNTNTPGKVHISAIIGQGCQDLYGAGRLFDVYFDVIGAQGAESTLDFVRDVTLIYDAPNVTLVPLDFKDGSLTVEPEYIRGDVNGDKKVNSADAAIALDITSGFTTPSAKQLAACDVNGDGACNSADSSLILCFAANQNWSQCGGATTRLSQRTAQSDAAVVVKVGEPTQTGSTLRVPIEVSNPEQLAGGTFSFTYDANQMTATGASLADLTNGFELEANIQNTGSAGIIKVALAGTTEITANGPIFYLEFALDSGVSSIDIAEATLNDAAGRDFATSNLQRDIQVVSRDMHILYLPATLR